MKLAENLKILRKERNISQEELASIFNITSQSVSKWELGLSCPDIMLLPEIADYFGVSIDELLGYKSSSTVNSINLQMRAIVEKDEAYTKNDLAYRLARIAASTVYTQNSKEVEALVQGKKTCNLSFGQGDGGVCVVGENSLFISTFKDMPKYNLSTIKKVYKYINKLANMNTLKVLFGLFNIAISSSITESVTIDEVAKETGLTQEEVQKAMNNLDIDFNKEEYVKTGIEKYSLQHFEQVPMLITLLIPSLHDYGLSIKE